MTTTMIVEYVAVVAVIALFVWLVPMRKNGIPGLRGRGRPPGKADSGTTRDGRFIGGSSRPVPPRPVPPAEQLGATASERTGREAGEREQDRRILAELDQTWDAGYADREADRLRDHRDSA
jgi:hypothetical protein